MRHRQGCEALGGYGAGVGACSCGVLSGETLGSMRDLYSVTGNITDQNTLLVNRGELRALLSERDALMAERAQAQMVCAEAYQVVGCMLDDLGQFNTERAGKVLDNLSQHRMLHDDVLPWPSFENPARSKGKEGGE